VILVDASDEPATRELATGLDGRFVCPLRYLPAAAKSLVTQRWQGIGAAAGDVILFLDDDVVLERDYISEVVRVFEEDTSGEIGGVGGLTEAGYSPPSPLNALLLRVFVGPMRGSYAGRVVGPAVAFFPAATPEGTHNVEWLHGADMAYRRQALLAEPCWEGFRGYSFLEDLHLSARVGRKYRLVITTGARLAHKGLGMAGTPDWAELGESMVVNRHATMHVLQRRRVQDYVRFVAYELLYWTAAQIRNPQPGWREKLQMLRGKLRGFGKLLRGRSPHRAYLT
jgi:cellulose synthase/poly-beta-1,6-N-acetylglucosamine synthase-like glycosyltransferase